MLFSFSLSFIALFFVGAMLTHSSTAMAMPPASHNIPNAPATLTKKPQRVVCLQGAANFRDLGGYTTTSGRRVAWNKLYRSDDLAALTHNDLAHLNQLPIATYVDFRTAEEVAASPDKKAKSVEQTIWIPIDPGNVQLFKTIKAGQAEQAMCTLNLALVHNFQDAYANFFELIIQKNTPPLVFHCSAGKDRTGFAAALFLAALGVERSIIFEDYMLSAHLLTDKYAQWIADDPTMKDALTVKPAYLATAFDAIDAEYGGPERYLSHNLHVDIDKLQHLFLE